MNKKFLMGGLLGLVAAGAGAFALTSLGNSEEGVGPAVHTARAESPGSNHEPLIFESEGGYLPKAVAIADGKVVKVADPVGVAPSTNDPLPAVDGGPAETQPGEDGDPAGTPTNDGEDAPSADPVGPATEAPADEPDQPAKPGIIYSDALVCAIIACQEPMLPHNGKFADIVCKSIACADEPVITGGEFKPCKLVGNCPKPDLIGKLDLGSRVDIRP